MGKALKKKHVYSQVIVIADHVGQMVLVTNDRIVSAEFCWLSVKRFEKGKTQN